MSEFRSIGWAMTGSISASASFSEGYRQYRAAPFVTVRRCVIGASTSGAAFPQVKGEIWRAPRVGSRRGGQNCVKQGFLPQVTPPVTCGNASNRVEVGGIEPPSFRLVMGLLRAQPVNFLGPVAATGIGYGPPARLYVRLRGLAPRCRKPLCMILAIGPRGRDRTSIAT